MDRRRCIQVGRVLGAVDLLLEARRDDRDLEPFLELVEAELLELDYGWCSDPH